MVELIGQDKSTVIRTMYRSVDSATSFYSNDSCVGTTSSVLVGTEVEEFVFDGYYTTKDFAIQCVSGTGAYNDNVQCAPTTNAKWYGRWIAE